MCNAVTIELMIIIKRHRQYNVLHNKTIDKNETADRMDIETQESRKNVHIKWDDLIVITCNDYFLSEIFELHVVSFNLLTLAIFMICFIFQLKGEIKRDFFVVGQMSWICAILI